jgi:predicted DNA-binding protein
MSKTEKNKEEKKQRRGAQIYVPNEFKVRLDVLSRRYGRSKWKILLDALSLYETSLRKPKAKQELPNLEKGIWYVMKLCMSVGAFKAKPDDASLQQTMKTVIQIKERLKIDTSLLEKVLQDYLAYAKANKLSGDVFMELNETLKLTVTDIVYNYMLKEEGNENEK